MGIPKVTGALALRYSAGTPVFDEGDPGSRMYVIRSGKVKIFKRIDKQELVLAFLGPGEFFGEMALLEGLPRSASAVTVEDTELVEVDLGTFENMIRRNIEIAVRIMRKLAGRVRELGTRLEGFVVDDAISRALDVLRWLLPQGHAEGDWVRLPGAAAHLDIATQAGIPPDQAHHVLQGLKRARCVDEDGDDLLIAHEKVLDDLGNYLQLKHKYGGLHTTEQPDIERTRAMRRLLTTLRISDDEVEAQQARIRAQHDRYLHLKTRFEGLEE